jgi:hypothetical protein
MTPCFATLRITNVYGPWDSGRRSESPRGGTEAEGAVEDVRERVDLTSIRLSARVSAAVRIGRGVVGIAREEL